MINRSMQFSQNTIYSHYNKSAFMMKINDPFFSVIMPSYKTEKIMVERAIISVLQQSLKSFELIIIDDNDNNEFKRFNQELEDEYINKNVKFIFHQHNKGANYARNTGITNAKGQYIAFIDSDDEWDNNYLKILHKTITEKQGKIFTTNYQIISPNGIEKPCFNKKRQKSGYIYHQEILEDILGPTSTVCVHKTSLISAGMFDVSLPARQDYDMWLRICKTEPCYFIFEPLVKIYRDDHESISTSYKRHIKGTLIVMNKLLNDSELTESIKKQIKFTHYKHIAKTYILHNRYKEAQQIIKEIICLRYNMTLIIWYLICYTPSIFKLLKKYRQKKKLTIA